LRPLYTIPRFKKGEERKPRATGITEKKKKNKKPDVTFLNGEVVQQTELAGKRNIP